MHRALLLAAISCLAGTALAEDPEPSKRDKSQYDLFHRTPDELMRPLGTDRPDTTDTPLTVDAGHVQAEMDFFTYAYDRVRADRARIRTDHWVVGHINLKLGVLNDADFELDWNSYEIERTHDLDTGARDRHEGFGDLVWRLKLNLVGNDGGAWALAIMPFLKIPTAHDGLGNGFVEGGIIFPISIEMPAGFDLGFTLDFDFDQAEGGKWFLDFVGSTSLGYTILERLRFYLELWGAVNTEAHSPWLARVDVGYSFLVVPNVQLDGGVNAGLTRATDDLTVFLGLSLRY